MSETDNSFDVKIQQPRITRSRFHYKPISLPEFAIITAFSVSIGLGMFLLSLTNVPQNNLDSQTQLTIQSYMDLF